MYNLNYQDIKNILDFAEHFKILLGPRVERALTLIETYNFSDDAQEELRIAMSSLLIEYANDPVFKASNELGMAVNRAHKILANLKETDGWRLLN